MHAITGGWPALPEVPWTTGDGLSFADLRARTDIVLSRLEAGIAGSLRDPVTATQMIAQTAELCAALRDLSVTELSVEALIALGGALERAHAASRRKSLRRL